MLLCQRVAQRANHEEEENGRFFQDRYRATRLVDEASLLACAAYVDLNPIRAAMCQTLESSDHTSVQRRIAAIATLEDYLELLDWSARQIAPGKRVKTLENLPPVLKRLGLNRDSWCELVSDFGKLFCTVAGRPEQVDLLRSHRTHRRHHLRCRARELFAALI